MPFYLRKEIETTQFRDFISFFPFSQSKVLFFISLLLIKILCAILPLHEKKKAQKG